MRAHRANLMRERDRSFVQHLSALAEMPLSAGPENPLNGPTRSWSCRAQVASGERRAYKPRDANRITRGRTACTRLHRSRVCVSSACARFCCIHRRAWHRVFGYRWCLGCTQPFFVACGPFCSLAGAPASRPASASACGFPCTVRGLLFFLDFEVRLLKFREFFLRWWRWDGGSGERIFFLGV